MGTLLAYKRSTDYVQAGITLSMSPTSSHPHCITLAKASATFMNLKTLLKALPQGYCCGYSPVGLDMDTEIFQKGVKIKGATNRIQQMFLLPSVPYLQFSFRHKHKP